MLAAVNNALSGARYIIRTAEAKGGPVIAYLTHTRTAGARAVTRIKLREPREKEAIAKLDRQLSAVLIGSYDSFADVQEVMLDINAALQALSIRGSRLDKLVAPTHLGPVEPCGFCNQSGFVKLRISGVRRRCTMCRGLGWHEKGKDHDCAVYSRFDAWKVYRCTRCGKPLRQTTEDA